MGVGTYWVLFYSFVHKFDCRYKCGSFVWWRFHQIWQEKKCDSNELDWSYWFFIVFDLRLQSYGPREICFRIRQWSFIMCSTKNSLRNNSCKTNGQRIWCFNEYNFKFMWILYASHGDGYARRLSKTERNIFLANFLCHFNPISSSCNNPSYFLF